MDLDQHSVSTAVRRLSRDLNIKLLQIIRIVFLLQKLTWNDGKSRVEMSERVDGRPDCVPVVLREDDDLGLLAAVTE